MDRLSIGSAWQITEYDFSSLEQAKQYFEQYINDFYHRGLSTKP